MLRCRSILCALVIGSVVVGCANDAPSVERFTIDDQRWAPNSGSLDSLGSTLLGLRAGTGSQSRLVTSADLGRTWDVAALPDAPGELSIPPLGPDDPLVFDDVAMVAGRDLAAPAGSPLAAVAAFHVWTSTDAETWTGHRLVTEGGVNGHPDVARAGDTLLASMTSIGGLNLFASPDLGRSWSRSTVEGLAPSTHLVLERAWKVEDELRAVLRDAAASDTTYVLSSSDEGAMWRAERCDEPCDDVLDAGNLLARHDQTSSDGGETWTTITLESPPDPQFGPPRVVSLDEVRGGWLANVTYQHESGDGEWNGQVLRSDDGRRWSPVIPAGACPDTGGVLTGARPSSPVSLDGAWFVVDACPGELPRPTEAVPMTWRVYRGDAAAESFELVEGTDRNDVTLSDPVVVDGRVVILETGDGELTGSTVIRMP